MWREKEIENKNHLFYMGDSDWTRHTKTHSNKWLKARFGMYTNYCKSMLKKTAPKTKRPKPIFHASMLERLSTCTNTDGNRMENQTRCFSYPYMISNDTFGLHLHINTVGDVWMYDSVRCRFALYWKIAISECVTDYSTVRCTCTMYIFQYMHLITYTKLWNIFYNPIIHFICYCRRNNPLSVMKPI